MEAVLEMFQGITFASIWNWIVNFYPLNFFGYNIPILLLVSGIILLTTILGATIKAFLKIIVVIVVIYLISVGNSIFIP